MSRALVVTGVAALASLFAAGLNLYGATIEVPDNLDTFIGALQHKGKFTGWASAFSLIAAACSIFGFVVQWQRRGRDE